MAIPHLLHRDAVVVPKKVYVIQTSKNTMSLRHNKIPFVVAFSVEKNAKSVKDNIDVSSILAVSVPHGDVYGSLVIEKKTPQLELPYDIREVEYSNYFNIPFLKECGIVLATEMTKDTGTEYIFDACLVPPKH